MNKDMISICLEEAMFDQENKDLMQEFDGGFKTAEKKGKEYGSKMASATKYASGKMATGGAILGGAAGTLAGGAAGALVGGAAEGTGSLAKKYGGTAAKVGLGAAYAGGALLLYKGIKALYNKLKSAKTPEAKIAIKSQINSKKAQLAKAKSSK